MSSSGSGELGLTPRIHIFELRCRGDLLGTLHQLDDEEDINKVLKYFSYEHFYVIYCKVRTGVIPDLTPTSGTSSATDPAPGSQLADSNPPSKFLTHSGRIKGIGFPR